jgi:D-alanine-D-alanine ligase
MGQQESSGREPGKIKVAVVFGGQSDEHDVSLRSAQTVMNALDPNRYEVTQVGISREGVWLRSSEPMKQLTSVSPLFALGSEQEVPLESERSIVPEETSSRLPEVLMTDVDIVFPVLHGPYGEDGTIQGMLELAGIPYVGSGVLGSALAMDKGMTKVVLQQAGIPQVPWLLVSRSEWERNPSEIAAKIGESLGYPCFTKPGNMGSSVGIVKVHEPSELAEGMNEAARLDRRIIVEKGVDARELEISVLGNDDPIASVAGEIVPSNEFYDYNAKYVDDDSELIVPAELDPETMEQIRHYAVEAFKALDLAGMARVDFFLERGTNQLYLNEVNTIPGFTSISMYPLLWEASGIPNAALVDRLIELALERAGRV